MDKNGNPETNIETALMNLIQKTIDIQEKAKLEIELEEYRLKVDKIRRQ